MLRFHWVKNCDPSVIEINKFTGLVFGLTQSPLKFENILKEHFQYYINEYPALIAVVLEDIYVDYIVLGSNTMKSSNKNPLSYFETAELIYISGTQISHYYNLPIERLKVNLLMSKKIKQKYKEHPGIKTMTISLLLHPSLIKIDNKEKRLKSYCLHL